jgi:hypothetical protein
VRLLLDVQSLCQKSLWTVRREHAFRFGVTTWLKRNDSKFVVLALSLDLHGISTGSLTARRFDFGN